MVSHITDCLLNKLFWLTTRQKTKLCFSGPFLGEFTGDLWISRHKGVITNERFPFIHLLTSSWKMSVCTYYKYIWLFSTLNNTIQQRGWWNSHVTIDFSYTLPYEICTSFALSWWRHQMEAFSALMFSLMCTWTNAWANNRDVGDLRLHYAHYNVTAMLEKL